MNPIAIIQKYYNPESDAYRILVEHSKNVTKKALDAAAQVPELHPDMQFIHEAAMLHDIGICQVNAPEIGCTGDSPYLMHGVLGRKILEDEGYPKHALVCERHAGVGITAEDVVRNNLPIPKRDYTPQTIEEEIIGYADKFYTKKPEDHGKEIDVPRIRKKLAEHGEDNVERFDEWHKKFSRSTSVWK